MMMILIKLWKRVAETIIIYQQKTSEKRFIIQNIIHRVVTNIKTKSRLSRPNKVSNISRLHSQLRLCSSKIEIFPVLLGQPTCTYIFRVQVYTAFVLKSSFVTKPRKHDLRLLCYNFTFVAITFHIFTE